MKKIKIGVIPAAGEGRRMGYLGHILPKCLFPLYDKPILHYIIENMKHVGIEEVYIVVNFQKEKIIEYVDNVRDKIGIAVNFIPIDKILGLVYSVLSAKEFVSEPFMVILGDDITITKSLGNLINRFYNNNAIVVEGVVNESNPDILKSTCCVHLGENNKIERIIEKPSEPMSSLRGVGIYIFDIKIFDYAKKVSVTSSITDAIDLVAKDGEAYAEFIDGLNINVNSYEDLLNAWNLVKTQLMVDGARI